MLVFGDKVLADVVSKDEVMLVILSPRRVSLVEEKWHTATQGRKPCEPEAETGVMHLQAQESQGLPADPRNQKRQGRILHGVFGWGGCMSLLAPWFQTPGLQNCEGISFCCLKPPGLC